MNFLVTSGCSCSVVNDSWHIKTWPWHLTNLLGVGSSLHVSRPAQSNGMISRQLIYAVLKLLETHKPEDLLVGVMWSGPARHDFYTETPSAEASRQPFSLKPIKFVEGGYGSWVLLHPHWGNNVNKAYYSTFHDDAGAMISTYEHILRTQWFLKLHNIKYFMSNIAKDVFNHERWKDHPDISYLRSQVDFEKFLPVNGIFDWSKDCSGLEFNKDDQAHPTTEQNKKFTEEIILPFLKENNLT